MFNNLSEKLDKALHVLKAMEGLQKLMLLRH